MSIPNQRILLVEDDEADIELTVAAFNKHKLCNDIVVARDGVEALDYLYRRGAHAQRDEHEPALVLLDLKMPRLGGIEVLETVKADERLRMLPVVVMSSSREDPDIQQCYELGVNAYVIKPIDFKAFSDAIRDVGLFWMVLNQPPLSRPNRYACQ